MDGRQYNNYSIKKKTKISTKRWMLTREYPLQLRRRYRDVGEEWGLVPQQLSVDRHLAYQVRLFYRPQ